MSLRGRLSKLERRQAAIRRGGRPGGIHVHRNGSDPRETCPLCKAMTPEEHEAWLAGPSGIVLKVEYENRDTIGTESGNRP